MQPIITKEKKEGNQTDDRTWIDNSIHGVVACDMRVYEEVVFIALTTVCEYDLAVVGGR